MIFLCINVCRAPREMLNPEPERPLPRGPVDVNVSIRFTSFWERAVLSVNRHVQIVICLPVILVFLFFILVQALGCPVLFLIELVSGHCLSFTVSW